jgi:hypothetical protein
VKRDSVSGLLLVTGGLAVVLVMALHPSAHGRTTAEGFQSLAHLGRAVHALALVATPVVFLGLLGAARRFGPSEAATAALVAQGFGSVAVVGAAVASGFVVPGVMERLGSGHAPRLPHALALYTSLWNRAFATIFAVAFAVAILLLSAAILRRRDRLPLAAVTGAAGIVIAAGLLAALVPGQLRMNLHGARIVLFAQAGWWIWLGILLCRAGPEDDSA